MLRDAIRGKEVLAGTRKKKLFHVSVWDKLWDGLGLSRIFPFNPTLAMWLFSSQLAIPARMDRDGIRNSSYPCQITKLTAKRSVLSTDPIPSISLKAVSPLMMGFAAPYPSYGLKFK
jgi:hypothetical protein